jgi:hypothetical protein
MRRKDGKGKCRLKVEREKNKRRMRIDALMAIFGLLPINIRVHFSHFCFFDSSMRSILGDVAGDVGQGDVSV